MPDRWGRVTHNDWNAMTGMVNNLQAMGQRNEQYRRQKDYWNKQDKIQEDTSTAFNAAMNPQQVPDAQNHVDSPVPGAPVPTKEQPLSQALQGLSPEGMERGLGAAQNVKSFEANLANMKNKDEIRTIANIFLEKGTVDPRRLPEEFKKDQASVASAQALAASLFSKTKEAEQLFKQTRMADISRGFKQLQVAQQRVSEAYKAGDKASVGQMIEELSEGMPLPYKYVYDEKTDTFKEQYLHSGTGKFEDNGTQIPYQEAVQKLTTMQPKEYATAAYQYKEATRQWNEQARLPAGTEGADGEKVGRGQWIKKDGQRFYVFPQKPNSDTSRVAYIVMDKDNNQVEYPNINALLNAGYRYEDLGREKGLLDIENKRVRNQQQVMGEGGTDVKAMKSQIDFYNKQFKTALEPFKEGGGGLGVTVGDDGQFSFDDGGAAFSKAQEFFHAHQGDWQSLSPQEQTKFHGAATADALYKTMLSLGRQQAQPQAQAMGGQPQPGDQPAVAGQQTPYSGNNPPVEGAKRAKDGKWYVQKNERWELVLDDGHQQGAQPDPSPPSVLPNQEVGPEDPAATRGPTGMTQQTQPQIRPELPQDMNQWNFQIISQNGRQVPVVITDKGPIPLTPEEVEMYRAFSAQHKRSALGSAIGAGVEWFKNNATGTQQIPR